VYVRASGYEVDKIQEGTFPGAGTTIRKQKAKNTEVVCFDLRGPREDLMLGVHAKNGSWEFRIWFQVVLAYIRDD